jgi:hypothetical protein
MGDRERMRKHLDKEVPMNKKTIGVLSIVLAIVVGFGALFAVPAVRADTVAKAQVSAADKTAIAAKVAILKGLYQQIRQAADAVRTKAKAAKEAGKDLTAFKADMKTALKGGQHLRVDVSKLRRFKLTESQKALLKTAQITIDGFKKQLKQAIDSKAPQATIDTLRALLKSAIAARNALVKSFHVGVGALILARLDKLTLEANQELALLTNLLARPL